MNEYTVLIYVKREYYIVHTLGYSPQNASKRAANRFHQEHGVIPCKQRIIAIFPGTLNNLLEESTSNDQESQNPPDAA